MPNRGVHQSGSAYRSAINYRVHFHVILPRVLMRPVCDRILTPWCRIINHNWKRQREVGELERDGAVNMHSLCLPLADGGYFSALRKSRWQCHFLKVLEMVSQHFRLGISFIRISLVQRLPSIIPLYLWLVARDFLLKGSNNSINEFCNL